MRMNKITFIPITKEEKDLLTKKEVMRTLEKKIRKLFMDSVKQKQIIRKWEEI